MNPDDFQSGVYQHYKGNHYLALGLAREDETEELVVVYIRLYARAGMPMSTRKLRFWNEQVMGIDGLMQPRFAFVGQRTP
jgi:hypothetical protein